jgi:hypothetical protein
VIGTGFVVGRLVKRAAKAMGASEKEAKIAGRVAGVAVSFFLFDPTGWIDIPDPSSVAEMQWEASTQAIYGDLPTQHLRNTR